MEFKKHNKGIIIENTDISLERTFTCGQCFRWHESAGKWFGIVNGKCAVLSQLDNGIFIENTDISEVESFWVRYLDLNTDYSCMLTDINDKFNKEAAECGKGIHILNQDPFETVISFIISSNNNIKRIEKIIDKFCVLYGEPIKYESQIFYSFPSPEKLSSVTIEDLAELKAGFRDKYIFDFIKIINSEPSFLKQVSSLDTDAAKKELMRVKGIGDKVSDCILLFAFERGEVFPKDIWIKKAVKNIYGDDFDEHIFGKYAGIAQQYIYYYARLKGVEYGND